MIKNVFPYLLVLLASASLFGQKSISEGLSNTTKSKPLVAAHRGGFDNYLPENSLSLFEHTIKNSAFPVIIELDIRESENGSLFIMHDNTVDRTTNGKGDISNLTDNYLSGLKFKDKNGVLTDETIPYFTDVLKFVKETNAFLMLDVKGNILKKVIDTVAYYGMEEQCLLLTFKNENTVIALNNSQKILVGTLVTNLTEWKNLKKLQLPKQRLVLYTSEDSPPGLIKELKKQGYHLMTDMSESIKNNAKAYQPKEYRSKIKQERLSIIITDYPILVSNVLYN